MFIRQIKIQMSIKEHRGLKSNLTCLLLTRIALRGCVVFEGREPVVATGAEDEDEATSV